MRIHLIRKSSIEFFVVRNVQSESSFRVWLTAVKFAEWNIPMDIKKTFGSADFLGHDSKRIVFNIGGNNYRLICKYWFGKRNVHLFICWIGTHAEYSEICKRNLQFTINIF